MKILCVGDIHGRQFWKRPVERYLKKVDKIIFVGDYFDPYPDDDGIGIPFKEMLNNFNEILELKRENPDKVVLLLGNHDEHYKLSLYKDLAKSTRFDAFHYHQLRDLFNDNKELFKICHMEEVSDKKVYFSHAGITKFWLDFCGIEINDELVDNINHLEDSSQGIRCLAVIGKERTWMGEKTGSPLWCDLREFVKYRGFGENTYQIFGHTRLKPGSHVSLKGFTCIDSESCFLLNDKCKLRKVL